MVKIERIATRMVMLVRMLARMVGIVTRMVRIVTRMFRRVNVVRLVTNGSHKSGQCGQYSQDNDQDSQNN